MKRQNAAIDPPFCAEATRAEGLASAVPWFYLDPYCYCAPALESEIFALLQ
nr:hypothetical protein [uncultured Campylobacter sp.]